MRGSFCCGAQIAFLRQCMVFLALNHRAFCLAGGHPHPGFVGTKLNSIENKVAQDRLAPVLGTMRILIFQYFSDGEGASRISLTHTFSYSSLRITP